MLVNYYIFRINTKCKLNLNNIIFLNIIINIKNNYYFINTKFLIKYKYKINKSIHVKCVK